MLNSSIVSKKQQADRVLTQYLTRVHQIKPSIGEIFILDRSNKIVFSTNQDRLFFWCHAYFKMNLLSQSYSKHFYLLHKWDAPVHELQFFSANSPIIRIPVSFSSPYGGERYQLSQSDNLASIRLRNCLGNVCRDVRLWKFSETERFIRIDKAEGIWTPELAREYSAQNLTFISSPFLTRVKRSLIVRKKL